LALKEVDPVGLHRQSGIHAQEILKFKIAPHKQKSIVKKVCLAGRWGPTDKRGPVLKYT